MIVSKRDSYSPVLTRTIGDSSTGTQVMPLTPGAQEHPPVRPSLEASPAEGRAVDRPTYVELPSPRQFDIDNMPTGSTSSNSASYSPSTAFGLPWPQSSPTSSAFESGLDTLVVDDDPLTRVLMKRLLTRLGCNVSTAENGKLALEMILGPGYTSSMDNSNGPILEHLGASSGKIDDCRYHIIFLDNQMPVLSGLKAIERLRELGRSDFVVGVTGQSIPPNLYNLEESTFCRERIT